ncbi:MAG: LysE family translocator [Anaerolineae bacterium]
MNLTAFLVKGVVLGFTAAIMPGTFQAYLINQAATHSWRRAALLSFAPLLSDGPIVLLAVFVLALIPEWALYLVQLVGGLFILYLAYRSLRSLIATRDANMVQPPPSLWSAVVINFLNPNVYIYWTTVSGPLFIQGWQQAVYWGVLFLVCFYSVMIIGANAIVLLVTSLRLLGNRIQRILEFLSIGLMVIMAVVQFTAGIHGLNAP